MSKKRVIVAVCSIGLLAAFVGGCSAQAKIGTPEVKAATPPEPPPAPPPPPAPEPPKADPPPAAAVSRVHIEGKKIEINEQVQFDKGAAVIKPESASLLDEIAKTIKDNNDKIKKLSIEGHTSDEGAANVNQKLSEERAKAVMKALIDRGIDAKKLTSKGFGETKPIGDNTDAGGRVKNRRVELIILDK